MRIATCRGFKISTGLFRQSAPTPPLPALTHQLKLSRTRGGDEGQAHGVSKAGAVFLRASSQQEPWSLEKAETRPTHSKPGREAEMREEPSSLPWLPASACGGRDAFSLCVT